MRLSVVFLTTGERTEKGSLDSINHQTKKADEIIVVRNVSPISAAFNLGYSKATGDYVVEVPADAILSHKAFEILCDNMKQEDGEIYAPYFDTDRKTYVVGLRMSRRVVMKQIGGYRDVPDADVDVIKRLNQRGWKVRQIPYVLGTHNPDFRGFYFVIRQWNDGKRTKSLIMVIRGIKDSMRAFLKTGKIKFLFCPLFSTLGFFLGKREDVRIVKKQN